MAKLAVCPSTTGAARLMLRPVGAWAASGGANGATSGRARTNATNAGRRMAGFSERGGLRGVPETEPGRLVDPANGEHYGIHRRTYAIVRGRVAPAALASGTQRRLQ